MANIKENYLLERAALGLISGASRVYLQGYNGAITTTLETMWPNSSVYSILLANFSTPYCSAADANDTAAGTGARTVFVEGVDVNYAAKSETIALNGQTSVNLVQSYMLINNYKVLTAGAGLKNAGIVYIGTGVNTAGVPAVIHETIPLGYNASRSFRYAVPAGKTLVIFGIYASSRSTTAGGHETVIEKNTSDGLIYTDYLGGFTNVAPLKQEFKNPYVIPEKTCIQLKVLATAGTGPAYAVADCLLLDKDIGVLGL